LRFRLATWKEWKKSMIEYYTDPVIVALNIIVVGACIFIFLELR